MNDSGNPFNSRQAPSVDEPPQQVISIAKSWGGKVLCVGFAIVVLVSLLLPGMTHPPEVRHRMSSSYNLKMIGLALHNYHDTYGSFPPAIVTDANGKPLYSWRVLLLPFMEEQALYQQFAVDEPWDSATNRPLLKQMPELFRSPFPESPGRDTQTPYVALVDMKDGRTAMLLTRGRTFDEISDGTSSTGMVIDDPAHPVPWTAPHDRDPWKLLGRATFDETDLHGILLVCCDGAVRFLGDEQRTELIGYLFCDDDRVPEN